MKLGAENRNKVYALAVLGVLAAYLVYSNFFSGPSYKPVTPQSVRNEAGSDTAATAGATPDHGSGPDISQAKSKVGKGVAAKAKTGEFHPEYIPKKKEDRPDVATIDPTIRFDLLDRAMKVPQAGAERDLFQISKTPPVKAQLASTEPRVKPFIPYGPRAPVKPGPPLPPGRAVEAPLVVPFKYYGVSRILPDGTRTAYFIAPGTDGDEIMMANEGTVLKKNFRIVQISADRVVVEDTQDKRRAILNMEKEPTQG